MTDIALLASSIIGLWIVFTLRRLASSCKRIAALAIAADERARPRRS